MEAVGIGYAIEEPVGPRTGIPKLSDALFGRSTGRFASFAAVPSNLEALETALMFGNGLLPFAAIVGPSGWGKTHLLESAAEMISQETHVPAVVEQAKHWLGGRTPNDLAPVLILDNVQDVLVHARDRQLIREVMEQRVRLGKRTLAAFTENRISRSVRSVLPSRKWQAALLPPAKSAERQVVLRRMASSAQVVLSDRLTSILSRKLSGDGRSMLGAVQRLRLAQPSWTSSSDELRAFGVLKPFFENELGWDLRDHVHEETEAAIKRLSPEAAEEYVSCVSIWFMLSGFGISEKDAASYYGIEPGQAFSKYSRAEHLRSGSCQQQFEEVFKHLVESLENL